MRTVQASEAKAKFATLLDAVEKGETIAITRHGECIAHMTPNLDKRRRQMMEALAGLAEVGRAIKANGGSLGELIAGKHEGHKF